MDPGDGLHGLQIQMKPPRRAFEPREEYPVADGEEEQPDGVFIFGADVVSERFVGPDLLRGEIRLYGLVVFLPACAALNQLSDGVGEFPTRCFGWLSGPLMASL